MEKISQNFQSNENIWDKIERINHILENNEELTSNQVKSINLLLEEISLETKKVELKVISFFNDKVFKRLEKDFGNNIFFSMLDKKSPKFIDNIDLLIDGENAYKEIMNQINNAKTSIEINIFIWRNDKQGKEIAKKIIEAANRGVKITISKDQVGGIFERAEQNKKSLFHTDLSMGKQIKSNIVDIMYENQGEEKSNIDENKFLLNSILTHKNITVINEERNDHSKYYIFDDKIIITGGMNIGDEYNKWHDYMVKMESPILVKKFKARISGKDDFDEGSSIEVSLNRWETEKYNTLKYPLSAEKDPEIVQIETKKLKQKEIKTKVLDLLEFAKQHKKPITIEMAYFGDMDISNKIIDASNSGVQVNIILPEKANIQDDLNKKVIQEILSKSDGNISVYFYPGMLHAKMIHIGELSGEISTGITFLGSANLNVKATEDLAELNLLINDKDCKFTTDIKKQLLIDIEKSKKYIAPPKITYSKIKSFFESIV